MKRLLVAAVVCTAVYSARGEVTHTPLESLTGTPATWTGAGSNALASNPTNWSEGVAPGAGAAVVVGPDSGGVSQAMEWDLDVPLFSWNQLGTYTNVVTVDTVYSESGFDCLTVEHDFMIAGGGIRHKSNVDEARDVYRLKLDVGGNFTLATNAATGAYGRINLKGLGYPKNPGYAINDRGGSHGGSQIDNPGKCYGSVKNPTETGSAGQYGSKPCNGGGAFYLTCASNVVVNGEINVDGTGNYYGTLTSTYRSGSGGSIYIKGHTVTGAGALNARGCQKWYSHSGGGGGRIALYSTKGDAGHDDFIANVSARPSPGGAVATGGTMYFEVPSDNHRGVLKVKGWINQAINYNNLFRTSLLASQQDELDEGFSEIVLSDYARLAVEDGVAIDLASTELVSETTCWLFIWGTILTPSAYEWKSLSIYPFGEYADFDAAVETILGTDAVLEMQSYAYTFASNLTLTANGQITHRQSGACKIDFAIPGNLTVGSNACIDATGRGVNSDTTKGYVTSANNSGASHGGRGHPRGTSNYTVPCWDSVYAPAGQGANNGGGVGSGTIKLAVAGETKLDGRLSSNGNKHDWGAGSGGSVILNTGKLTGTGSIQTIGGFTWNVDACGGAGRMAVTLIDAESSFDDFTGIMAAFGQWQQGSGSTMYRTSPGSSSLKSGAGSIYLRTAAEAEDEGTLIIDQFTTLARTDAYDLTEFTETMPDTVFGKVLVRNGARVKVYDTVALETSVWSNKSEVSFLGASGVRLVGDADGNAYVYGNTVIPCFTIDAGVKTVYFEAGSTNTITLTFTAEGTDASAIKLRSTVEGSKFYLDVAPIPAAVLDYLDIKDSEVIGGTLTANHSTSDSSVNWNCVTIPVGQMIIWNGSTDASWGNAANWELESGAAAGRTPVKTDSVVINAAAHQPTLPQTDTTLSNLTVSAGATLAMAEGFDLTVTGTASIHGTLAWADFETVTFEGNVNLRDGFTCGTIIPRNGGVIIANHTPATIDFGGNTCNTLTFVNAAAVTMTGNFTATTLNLDAGVEVLFAQDVEAVATLLQVNGESGKTVTRAPQTTGGIYALTVHGYADVQYVNVTNADSSDGDRIIAANSTDGGNNQNWAFEDTRKVWRGTSSTAFATAANWQDSEMPSAGDDVVVAADAANAMTITTDGVALGSLTVLGKGVKFSKPAAMSKSVVLLGGTTTVDQPITVGGSLLVFAGATLTHSAQGSRNTMQYSCRIDVGRDVLIAEGAALNVNEKGFNPGYGPGYLNSTAAPSYGGVGGRRNTTDGIGVCYGSVFSPTNCGSGGPQGGAAGGAFVLTAAGTVTLNGSATANAATSAPDCRGATGGALFITAGKLAGSGTVTAHGQPGNNAYTGGGGRISFVLTEPGADFSAFSGTAVASGGRLTIYGGGAGTVYYQTGDQAYGHGTIKLSNGTWGALCQGNYDLTGFGYAGQDNLRRATIELGANAGIYLFGDTTVGRIVFNGENNATYPANINFNGYTLSVNQFKPRPAWTDSSSPVKINNYYNGTYIDNIIWRKAGTMVFLR